MDVIFLTNLVCVASYNSRAKRDLYLGSIEFCTASLQASKSLFLLATLSTAPSLAPRIFVKVAHFDIDVKVSYFHEERW